MSLQITCLLVKCNVLIAANDGGAAGLWYCGEGPLLIEIDSCLFYAGNRYSATSVSTPC